MVESTLQNESLWYNQSRDSRFAQKQGLNYVQIAQNPDKKYCNEQMNNQ